jgi:hypothetical protein
MSFESKLPKTLSEAKRFVSERINKSTESLKSIRKEQVLSAAAAISIATGGADIALRTYNDGKFLTADQVAEVSKNITQTNPELRNGQTFKALSEFPNGVQSLIELAVAKSAKTPVESTPPSAEQKRLAISKQNLKLLQNQSNLIPNPVKVLNTVKENLSPTDSTKLQEKIDTAKSREKQRNVLDFVSVAGGVAMLESIRRSQKRKSESSENSQTPIMPVEIIPNREQASAIKYYNQYGVEIKITDPNSIESDSKFSITELEKKANETPRFQSRIISLEKVEGFKEDTKKFGIELLKSLGVSYTALKDRETSQSKKYKSDIKVLANAIVSIYQSQSKNETKFTSNQLERLLRGRLNGRLPESILKIAFDSAYSKI